jgi:hypothetical protein
MYVVCLKNGCNVISTDGNANYIAKQVGIDGEAARADDRQEHVVIEAVATATIHSKSSRKRTFAREECMIVSTLAFAPFVATKVASL